jgi:hypothetical protein
MGTAIPLTVLDFLFELLGPDHGRVGIRSNRSMWPPQQSAIGIPPLSL